MSLPKPVLPEDSIVLAENMSYRSASLIWRTWSEDPIKAAVLRAILSSQTYAYFLEHMAVALGQNKVCPSFHFIV